jgi:hypothetical protein
VNAPAMYYREVKTDQRKRDRFPSVIAPFGYVNGDDDALHPDPAQRAAIRKVQALRAKV